MARRSVAAQQKTEHREPASLPEVLVPLSEVPEHQRSAYQLELIDNPDEFRKVVSTEDFFQMIQGFPTAWWGERLSMYLYRHEDDGGLMVKNADGEGKYIKPVIRQAVDRDWVANRNGGGKYQLWLNLSEPGTRRQTTVRKYTFRLDGPPNVRDGQVVVMDGKPVSLGTPVPPPSNQPSETAQIITAQSAAAQASVEIVKEGVKNVMDMQNDLTRKQLGLDGQQKDPLDTVKTLLEIMKMQQPAPVAATADPMTTALTLMDKLETIIARRNPEPQRERETPLDDAIGMVEKVTGKPLQDILKGTKAPAESEYGWVAPLANFGMQALGRLPEILRELRESRQIEFERALYLRSLQPGQVPALPAVAQPRSQPGPQAVPNPSAATTTNAADPGQLINAMVGMICQGFDRHRDTGDDVAAAVAFNFGEAIESFGLERTLGNPQEMKTFIAGIPAFVQRSQDARWSPFEADFLSYMENRWPGEPDEKNPNQEAGHGQEPTVA
jgi:hypothetical protein